MKISHISATWSILTSIAQAAPTLTPAEVEARVFYAPITFYGAAGASFFGSFPSDDSEFTITNPLSVSSICNEGGGTCSFFGKDGSDTFVIGLQCADVAPPQPQIEGTCDI